MALLEPCIVLTKAHYSARSLLVTRLIGIYIDRLCNHHPALMCQRIPLHYRAIILNNYSLSHAAPGDDVIAGGEEKMPHFFVFDQFTVSADTKRATYCPIQPVCVLYIFLLLAIESRGLSLSVYVTHLWVGIYDRLCG